MFSGLQTLPVHKHQFTYSRPLLPNLRFGATSYNLGLHQAVSIPMQNIVQVSKLRRSFKYESIEDLVDAIPRETLNEIKATSFYNQPKLVAEVLAEKMLPLVKRAEQGENIKLISRTSSQHLIEDTEEGIESSSQTPFNLRDSIIKSFANRHTSVAPFVVQSAVSRLERKFPGIFKRSAIGTLLTKEKVLTGLSKTDVSWELLQALANKTPDKAPYPSMQNFWKFVAPNEKPLKGNDRRKVILRDFYNLLLEEDIIRFKSDSDEKIWKNIHPGLSPKYFWNIQFVRTNTAIAPSKIVRLIASPEHKEEFHVRKIDISEMFRIPLFQFAQIWQLKAQGRADQSFTLKALADILNTNPTTLRKSIKDCPALANLYISRIGHTYGTQINPNAPLITDQTFKTEFGDNWRDKIEAWQTDQSTLIDFIDTFNNGEGGKPKTVAFA